MKKEELDKLLEKFYSGSCSEEEERALMTFFTYGEVPEGYEAEKAIFNYYSVNLEVPDASPELERKIIDSFGAPENAGKTASIRKIAFYISAAASILLLVSIWFLLGERRREDTFSDPAIAYSETIKILYNISEQLNNPGQSLEPIAKMNQAAPGMEKFVETAGILEKKLSAIDYMSKAIDLSELSDKTNK